MGIKSSWSMLKETYNEWSKDNATLHAAALAYYTIFSLAPLLLILIAIVGLVYGQKAAEGAVMQQAQGMVGPEAAGMLQQMLQSVSKPGANIITGIIGIITLLIGAGMLFARLQEAMNAIWDVETRPEVSFWIRLRKRFWGYAMLLGIAFLLLVTMVVSAAVSAVSKYFTNLLPVGTEAVSYLIDITFSLLVVTLLFAMIFKILPDVKIPWRNVWVGAFITAVLFTIGKFLIGLYLGKASVGSAYGAAGSLVLLLIWVYYAAQILFFGAEFTQVWSRRRGTPIRPTDTARRTGNPASGTV